MEYIANHYIKVDGRVRFPGEIFQKEYDKAAEKRLIEAGAIRKADAPVSHAVDAEPVVPQEEVKPIPENEQEHSEVDMQQTEDETTDMDPPTVDVTDAVVTAPKDTKKNAKKEGKK
ncbi:MAG: hypothetical protein IJ523_10540 [Succinivibrionaceae bacterium]|nr:hypothetical protein [Succinivibrionaceae bacterium]